MTVTNRTSAVTPINNSSLNTVYLQRCRPRDFFFARFFHILLATIPDFLVIRHVLNLSIVHFRVPLSHNFNTS